MHRRIAVVDDEPEYAWSCALVLADTYDTAAFTSGSSLLEAVRRGAWFDLILLDVSMPQMNGLQVLGALGRVAANVARNVVLVSGTADDLALPAHLGGVACAKPLCAEDLLSLVGQRLSAVRQ